MYDFLSEKLKKNENSCINLNNDGKKINKD